MKFTRSSGLCLNVLLTLTSVASAINLDCKNVLVNKERFDLSPLAGARTVHWFNEPAPHISLNYTFTLDLCKPLKKTKGAKKGEDCPNGTRICCRQEQYETADEDPKVEVYPIAGEYLSDNRPLEPKWTLLKDSESSADAEKEGLRLAIEGGQYPWKGKSARDQKAYIEFLCNPDKTGLEGLEPDNRETEDDEDAGESVMRKRDESSAEEIDRSLKFLSYKEEGKNKDGVLRLQWETKYACEGQKRGDSDGESSSHWGFFTWFIIILFLAVAAYLIFGSWLNYNRYGARGWDLLPHGDTIRDLPYVLKDFGRRVVGVVQSGGSRGGYSAV